jgi:methyl-accepting chemotaxis protein
MEIRADWLLSTIAIAKLAVAARESPGERGQCSDVGLIRDTGFLDLAVADFRKARTDIKHAYAVPRPLMNAGSGGERLMKTFFAAGTTLKASNAQVLDTAAKGDVDGMLAVYRGADRAKIDEAMSAATADLEFNATQARKAAHRRVATYYATRALTILVTLVFALVCIGAGLAFSVSAVRHVAAEQEAELVAAGAYRECFDFEAKISGRVEALASGSIELEATARSMTGTVAHTEERATMIASASQQASARGQTMAVAAEELAAWVNKISQQVAQSARITGKAV